MNNNINRITKGLAQACKECITVAYNDPSAKKEILRGGGGNGGVMTKLLMPRPIENIRISEDALNLCLEKDVVPFDYFILTPSQLKKKYGNFFGSNAKTLESCHAAGHYLTGDHNIPNKAVLEKMFELCENDPNAEVSEYRSILNQQSYDLITLEENQILHDKKLKSSGSKIARDNCCSPKIEFTDLWLTPKDVIDICFELSGLNRDECLDPCASDGRWLDGKGFSLDTKGEVCDIYNTRIYKITILCLFLFSNFVMIKGRIFKRGQRDEQFEFCNYYWPVRRWKEQRREGF